MTPLLRRSLRLWVLAGCATMVLGCTASNPSSTSETDRAFDALDAIEIGRAVAAVREEWRTTGADSTVVRIVSASLEEPNKDSVLAGVRVLRRARVVSYHVKADQLRETLVNVGDGNIDASRTVANAQPMLTGGDGGRADRIVRADPRWTAALARRGITDMSRVVAGAWTAGYFGDSTERGRMVRVVPYVRDQPGDPAFLRPVEGVIATVNLTDNVVLSLDDGAVTPIAPAIDFGTKRPEATSRYEVSTQAIQIDRGTIRWRHWRLHVAPHPREGVVLHRVTWTDSLRERMMLYRASVSEMVVPYGDPDRGWFVRNAMDAGEIGLGQFVDPLRAGVDVPAGARFLSATMIDGWGMPVEHPRAIAVYERDGGLAWRFGGLARRSRELVVEWISTVGNYEYGFAWIFHEDGTIEQRSTLTGILSVKGAPPAGSPADSAYLHGERLAATIVAPHHQHFFAFRLDVDVDGAGQQQVVEVDGQPTMQGDAAGSHAAMMSASTVLSTERAARRQVSGATSRRWVVQNTAVRNALGGATGLSLFPGENSAPLADTSAWIRKRAGFMDAQLWVTPYRDGELYAGGEYPNQSRGGDGLPAFTKQDAPVADRDVVLWYVMGITHLPRPEDWPIMPSHIAGFKLVPTGFFDANPLIDKTVRR